MERRAEGAWSRRDLSFCAFLVLGSAAFYARAVGFDFVNFDDRTVLLAHPNLYNEASLLASLRAILFDYFPREEPLLLRDLSWAVDARIFGFRNPLGYHLGNVLLNAANVGLLFVFLRLATGCFAFAAWCTGAFAVLVVHVEPVCWVMGRKDLLASLFMLSALVSQARELRSEDPAHRRRLYLLGVLCTLGALLSKMSSVSFFLVLLLHRVFAPHLGPGDRVLAPARVRLGQAARAVVPHAAVSLVVFAWFHRIIDAYGVVGWRGPGPLDPAHIANVATFAPLVFAKNLAALFWPAEPSVFYRWPQVEIPLAPTELVAGLVVAGAAALALVWSVRRRVDLAFYGLAFAVLWLPYTNFVYVSIWSADRYLYLSSFPILAIATSLVLAWSRRGRFQRIVAAALAGGFVTVSAALAFAQQATWRDNESLWRHEASRSEPSLLSLQAVAKIELKRAEAATAEAVRREHLEQARALLARGLEREEALGRVATAYRTPEQLHLARLHYLSGRLAALEGGSLERQLAHHLTAHRLAPDRVSSLMVARTLYELGIAATGEEQERLIRESFRFFLEHVAYSRSDPMLLAKSHSLLAANYAGRFPFLEAEVRVALEGGVR